MRRMWISLLLLALGVFLVIAAGLSRFYVADQAVKIPAGQYARTVAVGHGTFFDAGSLSEQQADITAVRNVVPDVPASSRSTDVWQVGLQLKTGDGRLVSASIDRVALDRKTADAVNCCGEAVASALDPSGKLKPVRHSGLSYQFPISTKKQTYQFWDVTPEQALPTRYASQETVQGLTTYKFVQEIAPMQIGTTAVPGTLVGESASTFQSPTWYQNIRTVWVEPRTGVIIKGTEQPRTTLRDSAGNDKVIVLDVALTFDDATQRSQADLARKNISKINTIELWVPIGALVLGLLIGAAGLVVLRRAAAERAAAPRAALVPAGDAPTEELPSRVAPPADDLGPPEREQPPPPTTELPRRTPER